MNETNSTNRWALGLLVTAPLPLLLFRHYGAASGSLFFLSLAFGMLALSLGASLQFADAPKRRSWVHAPLAALTAAEVAALVGFVSWNALHAM